MTLSRQDLSPDQLEAFDAIASWVSAASSPTLTLGGFAGTGKTTVLSVFAREAAVSPIAFVAYTGKAASVLGRKMRAEGIECVGKTLSPRDKREGVTFGDKPYCGTIHSLIYKPCKCTEPVPKGAEPHKRPCPQCGEKRFALRDDLDRDYRLIVVDEASMVSDEMLQDLKSFGVPILAVGDHGQLPPVKGAGSLMRHPQIRLERIHRQAEKNPIIALSKAIRESGDFDTVFADGNLVRFGSLRGLKDEVTRRFSRDTTRETLFDTALLCYTNKRRVGLNQLARQARGFRGPPGLSEQVICLRNMRSRGVFNGMRGSLVSPATQPKPEDTPWLWRASIEFPDEGIAAQDFDLCGDQFNREKTFDDPATMREETGAEVYSWDYMGSLFDFGYAMTVHKAQGSGWGDVLVVAETYGMDRETSMRWKYTAVTRSSERLTVLR